MHANSLAEIIIYFEDVKLLLLSSVICIFITELFSNDRNSEETIVEGNQ